MVRSLHVLYGSQTGQAKSIAEGITSTAIERGFNAQCSSFDELRVDLGILDLSVMVVSTTGDGDLPDNCLKYFRDFKKAGFSDDHLSNLRFCLLCLGDTNYTNFCAGGKTVNELITAKGAKPLLDVVCADDATGMEDVIDSWTEKLWSVLPDPFTGDSSNNPDVSSRVDFLSLKDIDNSAGGRAFSILDKPFPFKCDQERPVIPNSVVTPPNLRLPSLPRPMLELKFFSLPGQPQAEQPYFGMASPLKYLLLSEVVRLSGEHSEKKTLMATVEGDFDYKPGDSFSMVVPNNPSEVTRLLVRLGVDHISDIPIQKFVLPAARVNSLVHIPEVSTLRYIFTYCVDFMSVPLKKAFFRMLADFCQDKKDSDELLLLSSRQGASRYDELRTGMLTLTDILFLYPSCVPNVERVIDSLPVLLPRPYSFCSTPLEDKARFSFVFNVVDIPSSEKRKARKGIATGHIESLHDSGSYNHKIPMFLRTQNTFRLPDDPMTPVIMIGPGTGVAPFIGFLKHRYHQKRADPAFRCGDMLLLFGCRTEQSDLLFRDDLSMLQREGILTELLVCFSRDENDSGLKYVQDILRQNVEKFGKLVFEMSAVTYICGDAANMAKDVNEALVDIFAEYKNIPVNDARSLVIQLRQQKQIKEDVWT